MPRPFHTEVDGIPVVGRYRERDKRGYYYIRFTKDRKRYELSTQTGSRRVALAITEDIVRRITCQTPTNLTVEDLVLLYIETAVAGGRMVRYSGRKEKSRVKRLGAIGALPAQEVTVNAVNDLRAALLAELSPKSVNAILSLLKSTYRWAVESGVLRPNPLDALRLIPSRRIASARRFVRTYTEQEFAAILEAARSGPYYDPIVTAAYSGMRRGEICRLKVGNVEQNGKRLFFRVEEGKSAKARTIPVHSRIDSVIRRLTQSRGAGATLFTGPTGRPLSANLLTAACRRALTQAGVEGVGSPLHTFRHTFATNLLRAGIPDRIVMQVMGHRDPKTLSIYAHITDRDSRDSVEAITW